MPLAAKEEMLSTCNDPRVFFPLAAFEGIGENSRLGFGQRKPARHRGNAWSNSARAQGIEEALPGSRGGCRSSGNSSTVHGQAYYFFHDFSIFGPKNDPRPSCFANFLKDTASNFIGYSGADVAGGVATATYILTPPAPVPPTMALRGGKYAANWIKAEAAGRVSTAAWTGLAANLVFAETLALGNELDSALNGNCK